MRFLILVRWHLYIETAPSTHDIDHKEWVSSCLTWGRISTTCLMSMWRNEINCRYICMFPVENLVHKRLRWILVGLSISYWHLVLWAIGNRGGCCKSNSSISGGQEWKHIFPWWGRSSAAWQDDKMNISIYGNMFLFFLLILGFLSFEKK